MPGKGFSQSPANLGQLVREQAGVYVWVTDPVAGNKIGDDGAHVAWLSETVARLRRDFDAFVVKKQAESQQESEE
jgi:hypothetical protein